MKTKIFGDKKITIRKISNKDLRNVKKFQDFINSFVEEDAKIAMNKKLSLREEREWMKDVLKKLKFRKEIFLFAECDNKIIGTTSIELDRWRKSHIGNFGITIRDGYRRMGLGKYLMGKILKLARKELKPKPKIIKLTVHLNNKPAIKLYKKYSFEKIATIPKQIQYKGKLLDEIIMILEI